MSSICSTCSSTTSLFQQLQAANNNQQQQQATTPATNQTVQSTGGNDPDHDGDNHTVNVLA